MKNYIIIGTFLLLFACQKKNDKKNLVFWTSNNAAEITFAQKKVSEWNNLNPHKQIATQPVPEGQSSEEIILASVVGKTTPDIYANMWQGSVEMYARSGVLIPLDTLKGFKEFIALRCDSSVIREITSEDGHIYQVPWKVNPIMTIYNKKLIESLGLSRIPLTYDEYYKAGKLFKKDLNGDGYTDQWLGYTEVKAIWYQRLFNFYPMYLAASGGAPLIKDNKAAFDNKHAIEVFRFLQEMYRQDYFSKEKLSSGRDPFIGKKIALKFSGPWEVGYLEKFKDKDFEYSFVPMPVASGHQGPVYTYCDPKNIVIFNTCKNPQAAWDFIKTLIDKQADLQLMELTGQFPRRKNLDTDVYFNKYLDANPKFRPFAEQAKYLRGVEGCEVIVEVFDIISQEYEACVVYDKKTPEKAIADAAEAVNVLLAHQVRRKSKTQL